MLIAYRFYFQSAALMVSDDLLEQVTNPDKLLH